MYLIYGIYGGYEQVIDKADKKADAESLVKKYKAELSKNWEIYYKLDRVVNRRTVLDKKLFGENLKKVMLEKGVSSRQLATSTKTAIQAVYKWTNGLSMPKLNNLYIISRRLGVTMDDLLTPASKL